MSLTGKTLSGSYKDILQADKANNADLAGASTGRHFGIPFMSGATADSSNPTSFGSGTDPDTSFTTAESNGSRASDLVPLMWYVCDDISIDAVKHIEGADTATGDTTRLHLFSYDFTSGATNCLTNGALLARSADTTNAGSEQPYFDNWTVDSAAVTAGKVIIATMEADSVNSDYSAKIIIKYHLT